MDITAAWFARKRWLYLLAPLAGIFALVSAMRRVLYRGGILKVHQIAKPVIVVGNLTVGGNGKTPVVIYLVEQLQAMGFKVGVISRGYGGKSSHYPLWVDASVDASMAGDEPVLIQRRCGCPVVVAPKRVDAAYFLCREVDVDLIISDDGLQHYALGRDLELVVIDGERRFGNGALLPMGPLREGRWRLSSVDFRVCNGSQAQTGEYGMALRPEGPRNLCDPQLTLAPCEVDAIAAIGHPQRFFSTLQQLGFTLHETHTYGDHHAYSDAELQNFCQRPLLMTEKDAVKCQAFAMLNWWSLPVSAHFDAPLAAHVISRLKEKNDGFGSSPV